MQQSVVPLENKSVSKVSITPKGVTKALAITVLILFLLHVGAHLLEQADKDGRRNWTELVDFDAEANLPTWYASLTLLGCAGLFALIGLTKRATADAFSWQWIGLSLIFLFLSADELSRVHERVMVTLQSLFHVSGIFRFAWVIPGAILVIIFAINYVRFLLHLPKPLRYLFLLAAMLYVSGALGMEMLGSAWVDRYGDDNTTYMVMITVEELLEMSGVIVLVYTLLSYMQQYMTKIELYISESKSG